MPRKPKQIEFYCDTCKKYAIPEKIQGDLSLLPPRCPKCNSKWKLKMEIIDAKKRM